MELDFHAAGHGVDLETYHPVAGPGVETNTTIKDRDFLARVTLTVWLVDEDEDTPPHPWERILRRPAWPLRLGRSQDLVAIRTAPVTLRPGTGSQRYAVVPDDLPGATGTRLRLTTAVAHDRALTRWDGYRYQPAGSTARLADVLTTDTGQAVVPLPATHPDQLLAA